MVTDASPQTELAAATNTVPVALLLARHAVGLFAVSALAHAAIYRELPMGDSTSTIWIANFLIVLAAAAAAAGLWQLFFTERSKGHFSGNFVRLAWVFLALFAMGEWTSTRPQTPSQSRSVEPPKASFQATPPTQERKIDELRRQYPRFQGLSDAEVLRAVANDYPNVPMDKIAADLGIAISPAR